MSWMHPEALAKFLSVSVARSLHLAGVASAFGFPKSQFQHFSYSVQSFHLERA